jgi:hypothetical protein
MSAEPHLPPAAGEAPAAGIPVHTAELPIVLVTLLEDRAMVTRRGPLPAAAGQLRLIVPEVSPLLVDKSLRAQVRASAGAEAPAPRVVDLRCSRFKIGRAHV